ncbi:MAG: YncE family protein [Thermodesulfobacteriota bacterium]
MHGTASGATSRTARRRLAATALAAAACGCSATVGPAPAPGAPGSAVVATIPLDAFGTGIAITPDGTRAYVAASASVFVVDTASRKVTATIRTGDLPHTIALSRDGTRGYAVDLMQREVWFLDLASNTVTRRVPLGEPRRPVLRPGVAVSPDGSEVYATVSQPEGAGFDLLYVIDAESGRTTQRSLSLHPGQLAADPAGRLVWIAGCRGLCSDGTLHGVDPAAPGDASAVALASVPGGMALSPDGARAYVANGLAGSVAVVDLATRRVVANVRTGAEPLGVAVSPDGARVYVTNFQSGTLSVVDASSNAVVATLPVAGAPRAIAVTPDGRFAWLTHSTPQLSVVALSSAGG